MYQYPIPKPPIQFPATQQTFPVFQPNQPNLAAYARQEANRFIVEAPKQLHQGATRQQTFPVPPVSQPLFNHYLPDANRYVEPLVKRTEGATRQQTYIFPVSQPYIVTSIQQPEPVKRLEPPVVTTAQTYIFPLLQPYIVPAVQQPEVVKRFEGAIRQQTYIFEPSQPDFHYYVPDINWLMLGPRAQFDGATRQQTYIFPLSQPLVLAQPATYSETFRQLDQRVSQQTFPVPPVSQPDQAAYAALERNRFLVEASKQLHQGATLQQTYIFPLSQPYFGAPTTIIQVVPQFLGLTPIATVIRPMGTAASASPTGTAISGAATGNLS